MAEMARITVNWTGFTGAPGFTNLYFRDFAGAGVIDQAIVDGAISKTDTWLTAWNIILPNTVNVAIDPSVEIVEDTTGVLTRFMNGTPAVRGPGQSTGKYSAASGGVINWYTNAVVRGRRLRGRAFMVPLGAAAMGTDGGLDPASLASVRTATATFINSAGTGDIGVWSRPSAPGAADGQWSVVTSYNIPNKVAVLRSRRD